MTVGRSKSSSILLPHPTVSNHHLVIYSILASPDASNALVFFEDSNSTNGTYFKSRRIPKNEPILLSHGDYVEIRHAARISLLQPNVIKEDVVDVAGRGVDLKRVEKTFQIHDRLIGEGGYAKVSRPHTH